MRELYEGGATLQEIGDSIGVTRQRVHQVLKAIGVPRRRRGTPGTTLREARAVRMEQILRMCADGISIREICRRVGCGASTVRFAMRGAR